ncbi:hypothetical protein CXG81DRAFT_28350 [Caulochytrium protostelioides]|uniref:Uncharacterized protein n=1 Tax=Caulochytrium protostelioides TaxID=1555241 RepID=A0A4P9WZ81_9FUNG|nr:hypothetical protein CXG81DRAFT_28350 [Caulochytrium protostelioides]|eukprot:RKO98859.1 hypothetical protein CXG81DRAFT_28350 [Caulochytrium protostelioides]
MEAILQTAQQYGVPAFPAGASLRRPDEPAPLMPPRTLLDVAAKASDSQDSRFLAQVNAKWDVGQSWAQMTQMLQEVTAVLTDVVRPDQLALLQRWMAYVPPANSLALSPDDYSPFIESIKELAQLVDAMQTAPTTLAWLYGTGRPSRPGRPSPMRGAAVTPLGKPTLEPVPHHVRDEICRALDTLLLRREQPLPLPVSR